jgi:hypothetical protein
MSRAATRISELLPEISHLNIFVHARKNTFELATSLQLWQNSGSSFLLVVWQS